MKRNLLTLVTYLLITILLLFLLGRRILIDGGTLNIPVITLIGAIALLSGFLAGAYYALSDRPGGAGEAQTPNLGTELTPVEKRSLALWWNDEPVILDLPPIAPLEEWEVEALTELCHSLTTQVTS